MKSLGSGGWDPYCGGIHEKLEATVSCTGSIQGKIRALGRRKLKEHGNYRIMYGFREKGYKEFSLQLRILFLTGGSN